MIQTFKKILLVTNEPSDSTGAEQTALALAKANHCEVLLVDSIRTPFQAPRFQSITTEVMFEAALTAKREYLEKLKAEFEEQGVHAELKILLSPRTSADLVSTAVQEDCDLVIRYLKGQSSRAEGRFGQTAENLMRACPVPVLLVEQAVSHPNVLACVNLEHGLAENQAIIESARRLTAPHKLTVLSCWDFSGREYMDEKDFEQSHQNTGKMYQELYEKLRSEYPIDDLADRFHIINDDPIDEIPKFCQRHNIDVAVMCSASLNHPLSRGMGSTIERTISQLPCGLMVVKPIGFESPIRQGEFGVMRSSS